MPNAHAAGARNRQTPIHSMLHIQKKKGCDVGEGEKLVCQETQLERSFDPTRARLKGDQIHSPGLIEQYKSSSMD